MFFLLIYTYCISQEGWFRLNSPTNKQLRFIDFINKDFGIIGGQNNLFITFNGGNKFIDVNSNYIRQNTNIKGLALLEDNSIILVAESVFFDSIGYSGFFKSNDSCKSWKKINIEKTDLMNFVDLAYYKNNIYWADTYNIFKSEDYGNSFTSFRKNSYDVQSFDCFKEHFTFNINTGAESNPYYENYINKFFEGKIETFSFSIPFRFKYAPNKYTYNFNGVRF